MSSEREPKQVERADRRRNREVIVAAARQAFARADAVGEAVSMNAVARTANVGIATLYRHFPSRDDLAEAVYQSKLDELTQRVRGCAQGQDGLALLRAWVAEFATLMLATRGMMDTLRAAWQSATPFTSSVAARIADVIGAFLADGKADHSIRDDVEAMDVTVAVLALLATAPPEGPGTRAMRLLHLFLDSLAPGPRRIDGRSIRSARP